MTATTSWVHHYVSTACLHGLCDGRCRATCKFCDAPCEHDCHPQRGDAVLPVPWVDQARDLTREMFAAVQAAPGDVLPDELRQRIAADPDLFWLRGEEQPPGQWHGREIYLKLGALIVADEKMLLISATADPGTYSLPGGPPDRGSLAEHLRDELGVEVRTVERFGQYEVVSGIDGALVVSKVFRVEVDGQPSPRQPGRSCVWVNAGSEVRVSTTVQVVMADAVAQGLVAGGSS